MVHKCLKKAVSILVSGTFIVSLLVFETHSVYAEDENTPVALAPVIEKKPFKKLKTLNSGDYNINEFNGELNYSYPVFFPAGRNNFTPSLSLAYSNSYKNVHSVLGLGWSLNIPKIERFSRTGIDDLYHFTANSARQKFRSPFAGGNGELLEKNVDGLRHGTYIPKVQNEKFHHEFLSDNTWKAIDSKGVTYIFGKNSISREQSENSMRIHTWFLSKIIDNDGNEITYEYIKSQGNVYLKRIIYGAETKPYEVRFEPYFSGTIKQFDAFPQYNKGFPLIAEKERLNKIIVLDPFSEDRIEYDISYYKEKGIHFLKQVQKTGIKKSGEKDTLPPTVFSYESYKGERSFGFRLGKKMRIREDRSEGLYHPYVGGAYPLWVFGDYDNDGWKDLISGVSFFSRQGGRNRHNKVILNNGNGTWEKQDVTSSKNPMWAWEKETVSIQLSPLFIDLNGDSQESFCEARHKIKPTYDGRFGCSPFYIDMNIKGIEEWHSKRKHYQEYFFLDYNGDGLQDALNVMKQKAGWGKIEPRFIFLKNNGEKFNIHRTGVLQGEIPTGEIEHRIFKDYYDNGTIIMDINNDGMDDIVHSLQYNIEYKDLDNVKKNKQIHRKRVFLSSLNGFQEVSDKIDIPIPFARMTLKCYHNIYISGARRWNCEEAAGAWFNRGQFVTGIEVKHVDVNRDGFPDLLFPKSSGNQHYTAQVFLNNQKGWEGNFGSPSFSLNPDILTNAYDNNLANKNFYDLNHDGILESITAQTLSMPIMQNALVDVPILTKIHNSLGAETEIEYTPASGYKNSDGSAANKELPMPHMTVSKMTQNDGMGNVSEVTYEYFGGKLYRPKEIKGIQKQEFLGFEKVIKTFDENSKVVSNYLQGKPENFFSEKGLLSNQKIFSSGGALLEEGKRYYSTLSLGNNSFRTDLLTNIQNNYSQSDSNIKRSTARTYDYDNYGNIIQEKHYGEVLEDNSENHFQDIQEDLRSLETEYAFNTQKHIFSVPKKIMKKDFYGNIVSETKSYYDNLPFGQIEKIHLTKNQSLVSSGKYLTESFDYNPEGLLIRETNARNYISSYFYNSHNLFLEKATNAKGHSTTYHYNTLYNTPKEVIGPNGLKQVSEYDALGNIILKKISNPSNILELLPFEKYIYNFQSVPIKIQKTIYTNNNLELLSCNYFDGFGRLIQAQEKGEGNSYIVTSKNYDSRGNIKSEFLPLEKFLYESEFIPINTNDPATHFSYDALNRIQAIKDSLGITQSIYGAWNKKVIDKNGNKKELYFDAYENLIEVKEFLDNQSFSTYYKYDSNNNLIHVTDPQENLRSLNYDFQGKLLMEEDLHHPSVLNYGKKEYVYDNNGNLIHFKNQANEEIVYEYDELDRIIKEQLLSESEAINFFYDTADYGIGKITQIETPYIKKIFSYDVLGRVIKEERVLEDKSYFTNFSYDSLGNILSMVYPDNTKISYDYNNLGLPDKIINEEKIIIKSIEYNPLKQISKVEYANGLTTKNIYDPLAQYRLIQKTTVNPLDNSHLQDFSYTYDAVGNFTGLNDNSPFSKKIVSYTYDDLDRLLKADYSAMSEQNDFNESYRYDISGNILEKSGQGSYLYNTVQPHAVTQVGDTKYAYDVKGNMMHDGSSSYNFNTKNQLISSEKSSQKTAYLYDESGIRIKKEDIHSGKNTLYVNRFYEMSGNETKKFIYLGDIKLATLFDKDINVVDTSCSPPAAVTWTITKSCVFTGRAAAKDIVVYSDVVLTIAADAVLYIDLKRNKLLIKKDGGVLIKKGGTIKQGLKSDIVEAEIASQIAYHHLDHLGGASIDTDEKGSILQSMEYYPFGETRVSENMSSYKNTYAFTGQELDEDTGLYYYKARYYHPEIGRFLSLDPWAGDISDPQTLNKYSYTRNNPLKYTDPSGEVPILIPAIRIMFIVSKPLVKVMVKEMIKVHTPSKTWMPLIPPEVENLGILSTPLIEQQSIPYTILPSFKREVENFTVFPKGVGLTGKGCGVNMSCSTRKGGGKNAQHGKAKDRPSDLERIGNYEKQLKDGDLSKKEKRQIRKKIDNTQKAMQKRRKGINHSQTPKGN